MTDKFFNLKVLVIATVLCLPALLPLMTDQFFHLHDFTHVARLVEMHEALVDGHFPVRWSRNLGYGYGLPQFNFYAPLAYYIAEIFHVIGFSALNSIKLLIGFNFVTSFMFMFYLVNKLWGRWAGILAGIAFIYIPYRAVDTYVRGALGELTAITMLAATIMCLVYWYFAKDKKWVGFGALAIAAMVLSHNLVALIAMPFVIVLIFIMVIISDKKARKSKSVDGLLMILLGFGLASFYAIPAFVEKKYTMVDQLTQGFSNFRHHFLYLRQFFIGEWGYGGSISGIDDNMSFQIGWLQIALAAVAGVSILFKWKQVSKIEKLMVLFSAAAVLFSMLISIYKSQFIWIWLEEIMQFIQFPWRFLSVIIVFISILVGASLILLRDKQEKWSIIATLLLGIGMMMMNTWYFKPEEYLENKDLLYYTDSAQIQSKMSGIIPDFIPLHNPDVELIPAEKRFEFNHDENELIVDVDRVHEFSLMTKVKQDDVLKINVMDFPGWQMYLNGERIDHKTDPDYSTMSLPMRENEMTMTISGVFENTTIRAVTNLISLVSLMAIVYLLLPPLQAKGKPDEK